MSGAVYFRTGRRVVQMSATAVCSDAVSHGQHACGIVGSGTERLRMVSGFVHSGLMAGDRVWCFPNGCRPEVLEWLHRDNTAGDDAVASGQLTVMPTDESMLSVLDSDPGGVIDGLRRAVDAAIAEGWNGFRLVGDLGWATRGPSCAQHLLDFEARVGEVLDGSPAAALCQYDRYRFDADTMVALTGAHAAVVGTVEIPAGEELVCTPLTGPALGLRLAGEVDLSNREVFGAALDAAMSGTGDAHLELSELAFIDHTGVQIMLQAAERLGPGRRLVLHRPPRSLNVSLTLLWETPKLVVAGEPA